jgi:hypothetical protein
MRAENDQRLVSWNELYSEPPLSQRFHSTSGRRAFASVKRTIPGSRVDLAFDGFRQKPWPFRSKFGVICPTSGRSPAQGSEIKLQPCQCGTTLGVA